MTTAAIFFMASSWAFVLGLTFWSFWRLMADKKHFDPDGIGPGGPPEGPHARPLPDPVDPPRRV